MSKLVFCSLVLFAVGCSSDDGADSVVSGGTGGGYALVGGTTSTSSANVATGGSASAIGGNTSATGGSTSEAAGATSTAETSSTTTGGSTSVGGTAATGGSTSVSTGGSSAHPNATGGSTAENTSTIAGATSVGGTAATEGSTSIPTDIVPATGAADCAWIAHVGDTVCPVKLIFVDDQVRNSTATFYVGCSADKTASANDWSAVCADVQCSPSGGCECDTNIPKGNYIQTNLQLGGMTLWAVGEGPNGIMLTGRLYVSGHLCLVDDAVKNSPGDGENFFIQVDC